MVRGRRVREQYDDGFAITPHDTNALAAVTCAIYVGGAGALKVRTRVGTDLTFAAVPAGTTIKISADRVYSSGTAATSIVGLIEAD